jgi:unsaturated rhamnogalacturonyl hydrolase
MWRCPDASQLDGQDGRLKWNYTTGLELKAFLDVWHRYADSNILSYVDSWYDRMIGQDGSILTYKRSNYSTDHICPGTTLFELWQATGKDKYRMAIDTLRAQLDTHPRTKSGNFWHKAVYPHQVWLDGLFMAQPFYARYTAEFEAPERKDSCFADIASQFVQAARVTFDPQTGLYRHAWDESRSMFWADPSSGQSAHAWGRALGWYCMALVEVIDIMEHDFRYPDQVLPGILSSVIASLLPYADPETGLWYQVLDCPGQEGNYLEATCNAMFAYSMLKGVRLGVLEGVMDEEKACQIYHQMLDTFVTVDEAGLVVLHDCCAVAGLGGKMMRSGTYDYYINEAVVENDPKGMGPLIWAMREYERYHENNLDQ